MDTAPILYNEFPLFLKRYFPYKVQKISLNAGFTCPNRDGSKGYGGCTYCNNQILSIAVRKSPLLSNWKKEKYSLPISILR
mgnify:CR=1 FL=1